jgi:hypothetical protein
MASQSKLISFLPHKPRLREDGRIEGEKRSSQ